MQVVTSFLDGSITMTMSVSICVALWFGLNAALVARRSYGSRQVKTTSGSGQTIFGRRLPCKTFSARNLKRRPLPHSGSDVYRREPQHASVGALKRQPLAVIRRDDVPRLAD